MPRENTVEIQINVDDNASKSIGRINKLLGGMGKAIRVGLVGAAGAITAAGAGILKLASDAAAIEPIRRDFERLTASIGETAEAILSDMREAAYGMVSDADLMQSANRLISMGLAQSAEEAFEMTRMAVRLGEAMGKGPTEAMEEFALMMANQSIPRLDTFGISAGRVRSRILELMDANEALSREEAFAIAVREEGAKSLERIGEGGVGAAANMARLQAIIANLKDTVGAAFIPVLQALLEPLGELATQYGPQVIEWAQQLAAWIQGPGMAGLAQLGAFLKSDVIPPLADLARVIFPALLKAGRYVSDHWDVFKYVAVALGAAILAITSPITALIAALAALYLAWVNDWGGIRTTTEKAVRWILDELAKIGDFVGKMQDMGRALIEGLWDGIESLKKWLKSKVESIAGWIPQWVRDKLGIGSPSKIFAGIGASMMEGLRQGLESSRLNIGVTATQQAMGMAQQRIVVVAPVMLDPRQYQNARGDYDYQSIGEWLMSLEKGL